MSGGMNPMSNQNLPSPSFSASNQMNSQVNPNMMLGTTNIAAPAVSNNTSPQIPQISSNSSSNTPAQANQTSPQQMSNTQHDLTRLRNLIAMLRDTLKNFFLVSGINLDYNTQMDNSNKSLEEPPKLEKSLEDILALCNQIELCLRTILECAVQYRDSHNYLPFQVSNDFHLDGQSPLLTDNSKPISYANYLNIIKKQVTFAKSIYDILSESVKQIKQIGELPNISHHHPPSVQQQQQPQLSHQPTGTKLPTQMHP